MDNSSSSHEQFVKQRRDLIENSKARGNQNTKFYILGGIVAVLLVAPLVSYVFLTQRILDNSSSSSSQVADVEEELVITPIIEPILTSTPSATPTVSR